MNVQGLMRGYTVPQTDLETYVGPGEQGQYLQIDLSNILGILSLIGAAGGARATPQGGIGGVETAGAGLADAFDFLTEKLPKVDFRNMFGNSSGTGDADTQGGYDFYGNRIG
jgi:hypothetical protein